MLASFLLAIQLVALVSCHTVTVNRVFAILIGQNIDTMKKLFLQLSGRVTANPTSPPGNDDCVPDGTTSTYEPPPATNGTIPISCEDGPISVN